MPGKHLVELFQPLGIKRFNRFAYSFVNLLSSLHEQAVIGHFLSDGVLEYLLQFGKKAFFINKFQPLQVDQPRFEVLFYFQGRL